MSVWTQKELNWKSETVLQLFLKLGIINSSQTLAPPA